MTYTVDMKDLATIYNPFKWTWTKGEKIVAATYD